MRRQGAHNLRTILKRMQLFILCRSKDIYSHPEMEMVEEEDFVSLLKIPPFSLTLCCNELVLRAGGVGG